MAKEQSGSSGIRRGSSSRVNPPSQSRAKPDSKVKRPAPPAAEEEAVAPPAPRRAGESKIRKPSATPPPDAAGDDAPPDGADTRARRQREQPEDGSFLYKKIAVLSVPVLLLVLGGIMLRNHLAEQANIDNAKENKNKGPVKIVKRDFNKEIQTAQFMFDQAFEHRKDAMIKFSAEPEQKKASLAKGLGILDDAAKICADALKEVGDDLRGFEYITEMRDQIAVAKKQFQAMMTEEPAKEPEKAPGTTTQGTDGKKDGEKKDDGAKKDDGKTGDAPKDDAAKKDEGKSGDPAPGGGDAEKKPADAGKPTDDAGKPPADGEKKDEGK